MSDLNEFKNLFYWKSLAIILMFGWCYNDSEHLSETSFKCYWIRSYADYILISNFSNADWMSLSGILLNLGEFSYLTIEAVAVNGLVLLLDSYWTCNYYVVPAAGVKFWEAFLL
jgi:hypothetical protein